MIFQELLKQTGYDAIFDALWKTYYSEFHYHPIVKRKHKAAIRSTYDAMLQRELTSVDGSLIINCFDEDDNSEDQNIDVYITYSSDASDYSLINIPWGDVMASDVRDTIIRQIGAARVCARVIWEMTFYGWSEDEIQLNMADSCE